MDSLFLPSLQLKDILAKLSGLFSQLLSDDSPVVTLVALETFAAFAQTTSHESVVAESMQSNESIQEMVMEYLNQVLWSLYGC